MACFLSSRSLRFCLDGSTKRLKLDILNCGSVGLRPVQLTEVIESLLDMVGHHLLIDVFSLTTAECAYALRYIELNHRSTKNPWSLRQTAVYQRYNSKSESSTWVIISASEKMEICLDRYLKSKHAFGTQNPFEIHLLLLETALANWRPFIISLTQKINEQVSLT